MFTGFGGFLLFSLDNFTKTGIIKQVKDEAVVKFGSEKMQTSELREKLSDAEKQQVLTFLFNRAEELAMEALLR